MVTFLFTDIEGSSQRWDRSRASMRTAVATHDAILHGDRLILPGSLPYRELVVRGQQDLQDGLEVTIDNTVIAGLAEDWSGVETRVEGP